MIDRRDLLRGAAVGLTVLSTSSASACSYAEYEDDLWGSRLIEYLESGRQGDLEGLFQDFTTLVAFDSTYTSRGKLSFAGPDEVQNALMYLRRTLTRKGWVEPRTLVEAKIVGSEQQGRMSRIELLFAESVVSDTSCGPDRSESRVDLYYQAGVYEMGDEWVKWAIERIAIMPPLQTEKFSAW